MFLKKLKEDSNAFSSLRCNKFNLLQSSVSFFWWKKVLSKITDVEASKIIDILLRER